MTLHLWLVYTGVIVALIAIPGPSALISMTHGLRYGQRRAIATIVGGASAALLLMTGSALGLGAILAASTTAFMLLKVVGAAYLIWLGISAWRAKTGPVTEDDNVALPVDEPGVFTLFRRGFTVGISNPKDLLFFAALFPNFIDTSAPHVGQFALLALTWTVLDCSIMADAFGQLTPGRGVKNLSRLSVCSSISPGISQASPPSSAPGRRLGASLMC